MKDQPSFTDQNITSQPIGNDGYSDKNSSSEIKKEKETQKCSTPKKLIIIVGAAVLIATICIILVLILKDRNKNKKDNNTGSEKNKSSSSFERNSSSPISSSSSPPSSSSTSDSSSSNLPSVSSTSDSSSSTPSSSSTQDSSSFTTPSSSSLSQAPTEVAEETLPLITFDEAQNLMNSEKIEENHKLLNESSGSVSESLNLLNETTFGLNPINTNVSYTIPDFLDNATDSTSKIVKSDINLYNSKYEELEEKAIDLTESISESMKDLSTPLDNIKEGVNEMIEEFENDTISFSLPLSLINITENIDKRRRLALSKKVEEYKEEVDKLNYQYYIFFIYIKHITEIISKNVIEIPS